MASLLQLPDSATTFTTTSTTVLQNDASIFGSSSASQIAIGIITGLVSTSVQSLGLTLQRKSHLLEEVKPAHLIRPGYRRRKWQIGMTLFVLANLVGSSVQITMLPLVILCSLQASGLVFNSICATVVLSEAFTTFSLAGTVLVTIGAGLIAIYGAMKDPAHSIDELLELFFKTRFLVWMFMQAVIVCGLLLAARLSVYLRPRQKHTTRMKMFRGVIYGCVSGILSADCLLLAKCGVELLVRTFVNHQNQLNRYESWLIVVGLIGLGLTQLYYLHRGLRLISTSLLYPLCFCLYNITAICDGVIYYNYTLPALHIGLIALGTVILLGGVLLLSWRLSDENAPSSTARPPFPATLSRGKTSTTTATEATEETSLLSPTGSLAPDDEETQLRPHGSRRRTLSSARSRKTSYNTIPLLRTPTLPSPDIDDVDEIWDELEEDNRPLLDRAITSPRIYRRVVTGSGYQYTRVNVPAGDSAVDLHRSVTGIGDEIITREATVAAGEGSEGGNGGGK